MNLLTYFVMYPNLSLNSLRVFELVVAARSGDDKASSKLMELYSGAIFLMILKMVNNKKTAESLAIEVFEYAFTNLHNYDSRFSFTIWLFRIASKNAIAHLQQKTSVIQPHYYCDN